MRAQDMECWAQWGSERHPLVEGETLTFGRSTSCDITVAVEDVLVSRRAGELRCYRDHLEVLNTSTTRELRLRPPVGPDAIVRPGGSGTSRGMVVFQIVLMGGYDRTYSIDCRGPRGIPRSEDDEGEATAIRPFELTPTERRMVRELCRPMLLRNGDVAQPATYAEVAAATGGSDRYARNVLKGVRDRLTAHGISGLAPDGTSSASDLRRPLCEFAIANGWAFDD